MSGEITLLGSLVIFILAVLVGFEVISKVPATLHTPLMSGANSIHGIVLIGGMIIAAEADDLLGYTLAFVAVVFGAMNVVGGYVVTDRMLQMFRKKPTAPKADGDFTLVDNPGDPVAWEGSVLLNIAAALQRQPKIAEKAKLHLTLKNKRHFADSTKRISNEEQKF